MPEERQLSLIQLVPTSKEPYQEVMRELTSQPCQDCRLGVMLHPTNRGVIWRGNLEAKIAVIGEAPGDTETEKGLPLIGKSGLLWSKWARFIKLDEKMDVFITNVIQCQPDKPIDKETGKPSQRPPDQDEIQACFGPRALRILRSMPNLEVVITLGWVAAKALLGGEPISKTHQNKWFKTSYLPGVAVFCLVHPSYIIRDPNPTKSGEAQIGLENFRREYLHLKKVHGILKAMEEEEAGF